MSEQREIDRAIKALRLEPAQLTRDELGGVWLLAAAGELLKHCPDASDGGHAFESLMVWAAFAVPQRGRSDVRRLADSSAPQALADWLIPLSLDTEISNVLPPQVLIAALVATLPAGHSQVDDAWNYIYSAANATRVTTEFVAAIRGWLRAEASAESDEFAQLILNECASRSPLARRIVDELVDRARRATKHAAPRGAPPFLEVRQRALACVARLEREYNVLFANRSNLKGLRSYLEQDYFRVAVLGGFNRGKSTLINALLGTRDLLPTSDLPSTSALIAVRADSEQRYERQTTDGRWVVETRDAFIRWASNASAPRAERGPEGVVPRWRVFTNSVFLREQFVELVDTPGLKEDDERSRLAKDEAGRADAAIIVLDPEYLSDSDEHELIASMGAKADRLILVVNKADRKAPDRWPALTQHLQQRLRDRGVDIPEERIVYVSAQLAQVAALHRNASDSWACRMDGLRTLVQRQLINQSGPLKAEALRRQILNVVPRERAAIHRKADEQKQKLRDFDQVQTQHARAEDQAERVRAAIERAASRLREGRALAMPLVAAFEHDRPKILDELRKESDSWRISVNPLFSPRKYVNEAVHTARASIQTLIERWFANDGAGALLSALEQQFSAIRAETDDISEYLQGSRSADKRAAFAAQLRDRVLLGLLDEAAQRAASVSALGRSVVVAVGALLAGYIVADIVLFYIFGAIAGFLAWPLLAAAALVGVAAGATKGREYAESWVRSKICDEIQSGFESEEGRAKLRDGVRQACDDLARRLAQSFQQTAQALVEEATEQANRERKAYEQLKKQGGDRAMREARLRAMEDAKHQAELALGELERLAHSLEGEGVIAQLPG